MVRGRIGGGGCSEHPAGTVVAFLSLPAQRAGGGEDGGKEYRKCQGCAQLLEVPGVSIALKCRGLTKPTKRHLSAKIKGNAKMMPKLRRWALDGLSEGYSTT